MAEKRPDLLSTGLVRDPRCPLPFESSWSLFVKLLHWNVMTVTELVRLIRSPGASLKTGMLMRFDGSWVDFDKFSAITGVSPSNLRDGFLTELNFPVPGRDWAGVRHCPRCIEQGFHPSLFDVVLLDSCPWHSTPLTDPCRQCLDAICTAPQRQHSRCPHIGHLLAPFSIRARTALPAPELLTRVAADGRDFFDWWAAAGRSDPDRNVLISDYAYAHKDQVSANELFKLSFMVKKTGPLPIDLRIPTMACDSMRWLERPVRSPPQLANDLAFLRCYKSLRRHLQKRFLKCHRHCLRRLAYFDTAYSPVFLNSCQCRVALFFCAWREAHELIYPRPRSPWAGKTTSRIMEVNRLQPFHDSVRSALHFLYADFVRALWQLCSLEPDRSYEIGMFRQPSQRQRLIGLWEGLPHFHETKAGDLRVPLTLVYPEVSSLLEVLQTEECPQRPSFKLAQRLPEEMCDNPEQRLVAVQVAGDKRGSLARVNI